MNEVKMNYRVKMIVRWKARSRGQRTHRSWCNLQNDLEGKDWSKRKVLSLEWNWYEDKLQRVQNTVERVTHRQGKFDRITPILEELHWLPIEKHITFKLATLSYIIKSIGQQFIYVNFCPTINQSALSDPLQNFCWPLMLLKLILLLVVLDILP